jgi:hypothetical protein
MRSAGGKAMIVFNGSSCEPAVVSAPAGADSVDAGSGDFLLLLSVLFFVLLALPRFAPRVCADNSRVKVPSDKERAARESSEVISLFLAII